MLGLYARDSYLDYRIVDFLLSLELCLKRKGGVFDYLRGKTKTKYLHRLAMQKRLPREILKKPKQGGSIDMSILLGDPNRKGAIFKYIRSSEILEEYLDTRYLRALLEEYEALSDREIYWQSHRDSKANKILYLLTFSLWYDIFVGNSGKHSWDVKLSDMLSGI